MKLKPQLTIAALIVIGFSATGQFVYGELPQEQPKTVNGEVRLRYQLFGVNKDEGRFREDNWMTDGSTGGLEWLHIESIEPGSFGYQWMIEGWALYDYDYNVTFLAKKPDSHYFKFQFDSARRYEDGSNEYWNQSTYGLPASSGGFGSIGGTSEHEDENFFIDRRNFNAEFGLTLPDLPQLTIGWHRLVKDGTEVLARGARARLSGDPVPRFRGIPVVNEMDGTTDTLYAEVAWTMAEKYNFRVKQEFEQYRDKQLIEFPRYLDGGVEQYRTFVDTPGYTNWRTTVMFDSFLNDNTYVTLNYMYNHLRSNTGRDVIRTHTTPPTLTFVNNIIKNIRKTHVITAGYKKFDVLKVPDLYLSGGIRVEKSDTSANGSGLAATNGPAIRTSSSDLNELRIEETMRLVYKGFERTTLSVDGQWEQRYMRWSELEDVRSFEIGDGNHLGLGPVAGVGGFLDYEADINHFNQVYTFKAVHRLNRAIRGTAMVRFKDKFRRYTDVEDNDTRYSPGVLGNYRVKGEEFSLKTDITLNASTSATLRYDYIHETINTEVADGAAPSDWTTHRGAVSLSCSPLENLFVVTTGMYENQSIESPAFGTAPAFGIANGAEPYDFKGNAYSLLVDGTWAFNSRTSSTIGYRHTEAMGTIDYAGDYSFDTVAVTLKRKLTKDRTLTLGYQFMSFNSRQGDGGDFDDYTAHGVFATFGFIF